jgi:hypothetical protein
MADWIDELLSTPENDGKTAGYVPAARPAPAEATEEFPPEAIQAARQMGEHGLVVALTDEFPGLALVIGIQAAVAIIALNAYRYGLAIGKGGGK